MQNAEDYAAEIVGRPNPLVCGGATPPVRQPRQHRLHAARRVPATSGRLCKCGDGANDALALRQGVLGTVPPGGTLTLGTTQFGLSRRWEGFFQAGKRRAADRGAPKNGEVISPKKPRGIYCQTLSVFRRPPRTAFPVAPNGSIFIVARRRTRPE